MPLDLTTKVSEMGIIGRRLFKRLKILEIETVRDLIFYFPVRHVDLTRISSIKMLVAEDFATIRGRIELIKTRRSPLKKKILTEAIVDDGEDKIKIIWFNQPYLAKIMKSGDEYYFSGKIFGGTLSVPRPTLSVGGAHLEMVSPEYEKVKEEQTHLARIVPLYSLTAGISQKQLRFLIKESLETTDAVEDFLPSGIIQKFNLMALPAALREVHFPGSGKNLQSAVVRLKFDELFLTQLLNKKIRYDLNKESAVLVPFDEEKTRQFVESLPFRLTEGQRKAAWAILKDLGKPHPMNRLLNGDVGSGKTVVAAIAALNAVNGEMAQVAFMAPTEILAMQHFESFAKLFSGFSAGIGLLTGDQNKFLSDGQAENVARKELLSKIKTGKAQIVLGTHALIEDRVIFKNLVLAIVDEQHRFGVEQRKSLRDRVSAASGAMPHLLSMTATPIPRTLSLVLYGDLDISYLEEVPKNRKPIITKLVPPEKRAAAYEFIAKQIDAGRQVFVICPLIDVSDKLGVKSAKEEFEKLQKVFPNYRVGLLYGRMPRCKSGSASGGKSKIEIMHNLQAGKIDILVATSVIEVGIDIPNATVMMIEGAERFGLAQLHQFRGRVGRGEHQSYCLLFTDSKSEKTLLRLSSLLGAKNGFELAEMDLKLRGAGEIYGTKQSGFADFKIATLYDYAIMKDASEASEMILEKDSSLENYPLLKQKMDGARASIHFE